MIQPYLGDIDEYSSKVYKVYKYIHNKSQRI